MNEHLRQHLLEQHPPWLQALMFLPEARREATGWLWLLLAEMQQTALLPSQTGNARMKLAWWQEQIQPSSTSNHPAVQALQHLRPDLLQDPHWPGWFQACEQLLTQPVDQALFPLQQHWLGLEQRLEESPGETDATARMLAGEMALAQHRNRIRFGLPGHAALADIPADFWQALPEKDPRFAQADTRIRQLAGEALAVKGIHCAPALASRLRAWLAHYRLGQWQKRGLGAYNGLNLSPWRSLLGFWHSARRHRSRQ